MATTGGVWIIPSFRIWGYVLYVIEHISCVIKNCGQHQWAIPSLFSTALEALQEENITRKLLSLSLDLFFKISLFQVTFLIFFSIAVFSPYFLLIGCVTGHVTGHAQQRRCSRLTFIYPTSNAVKNLWLLLQHDRLKTCSRRVSEFRARAWLFGHIRSSFRLSSDIIQYLSGPVKPGAKPKRHTKFKNKCKT